MADRKGGVPAPKGDIIWPNPTAEIQVYEEADKVVFRNFGVGKSELKRAHTDFITAFLVPHIINQLEGLGFNDTLLKLKFYGTASATGNVDKNKILSAARAQAVGDYTKKEFFRQAGRSEQAKQVTTVVIEVKAGGDDGAKAALGVNPATVPAKIIEDQQGHYRAAWTGLNVFHEPDAADKLVEVRQIIDPKFKVIKEPTTLLEMKLEKLKTFVQETSPLAWAHLSMTFDVVKGIIINEIKSLIAAADFYAPEIALLFKTIDFLVTGDIATHFQFQDSRKRLAKYVYLGETHTIDISALEALCHLLSLVRWSLKLEPALDELEKIIKAEGGGQLDQRKEWIDKALAAISNMKMVAKGIQTVFNEATAKGGFLRKRLGDEIVDKFVALVTEVGDAFGGVVITTGWFPCTIEDVEVPDIFSFAGIAQTEIRELFAAGSSLKLDFGARHDQPLLGFQGHALIQRDWKLSATLASFQISRGKMQTAA